MLRVKYLTLLLRPLDLNAMHGRLRNNRPSAVDQKMPKRML